MTLDTYRIDKTEVDQLRSMLYVWRTGVCTPPAYTLVLHPLVLLQQRHLCQLPGDLGELVSGQRLLSMGGQAAADGGGVGEGGARVERYPPLPVGRLGANLRAGELP